MESPEEHREYLLEAIKDAKEYILITSKDLNGIDDEILGFLQKKKNEGVRIYIFVSELDSEKKEKCRKYDIYPSLMNVHAKIMSYDKKKLAIGSFNWLGESPENSINHSIALKDSGLVRKIETIFWVRRTEYNNSNLSSPKKMESKLSNGIYLLSTPQDHIDFVKKIFMRNLKKLICMSLLLVVKVLIRSGPILGGLTPNF